MPDVWIILQRGISINSPAGKPVCRSSPRVRSMTFSATEHSHWASPHVIWIVFMDGALEPPERPINRIGTFHALQLMKFPKPLIGLVAHIACSCPLICFAKINQDKSIDHIAKIRIQIK